MPTYLITDPQSGRKLRLTGDSPPTEQELEEIFASAYAPAATTPEKPESFADQAIESVGNVAAGALRGAGSIGATILAPIDIAKDAMAGKGLSLESNRARRAAMDGALQSLGADPNSLAYRGGKLGTELLGTAPIGGILGKTAQYAGATPKVINALSSSGFSLGSPAASTLGGRVADMALRAGAGGIVGGASSGLVDPELAGTGALIGGAMPGAVQAVGKAGKALGRGSGRAISNLLGATTGTGDDAVRTAYRAGKEGSTEFLENLRGQAQFNDVVDAAKQGLTNMRMDRQAAYRSGMADISSDKTVLDFAPIDKAMQKVAELGSYKGVAINKSAAGVVDDLEETVGQWRGLDPAEYHTPEGLDALKQAVGDIRDNTNPGTAARRAADQVYNAVKEEIVKQAPTYAKVMKDYTEASRTLSEIEKGLSLTEKASKDTAIRKLQSLLRNNAQSNYGNRLNLAETLQSTGRVDLMPSLAGQAMNSWMPRGITGSLLGAGALPAALVAPKAIAGAALASPRLMGEAAYALGRGANAVQQTATPAARYLQGLLAPIPQPRVPSLPGGLLRVAPAVTLSSQTSHR